MILETHEVTKRFGGLVAVKNVSLSVQKGEIFGLIGPNGAGKTTLLNVIAGVHPPDGGQVTFNGARISGLSSDRICKRGIARTFQICQLFPKMSVIETVLVAAQFGTHKSAAHAIDQAREVLRFVEFPYPELTPVHSLNTGQVKRVDLARALASEPQLLLLDEPGAGLTPTELIGFMDLLRRIRQRGTTIVVVEHLMRVIMGVCDRMAVLRYGELIALGNPEEIRGNQQVVEAYLGTKYVH